jgi:large subunit ribosomal protein L24
MHVKKGDLVEMISGAEKGKRGEVLVVDYKHNRVKVQGLRMVTRHLKPTEGRTRRVEQREAYFPASKVLPVDPTTDKPTRVAIREIDGRKVRVAQKSGAVLDAKK